MRIIDGKECCLHVESSSEACLSPPPQETKVESGRCNTNKLLLLTFRVLVILSEREREAEGERRREMERE